eukprot:528874-Prorocentrum_minimum.AAC.2
MDHPTDDPSASATFTDGGRESTGQPLGELMSHTPFKRRGFNRLALQTAGIPNNLAEGKPPLAEGHQECVSTVNDSVVCSGSACTNR